MHSSGWMTIISPRSWMQSTGHTSTHEASLTPKQGCMITYGTDLPYRPYTYIDDSSPCAGASRRRQATSGGRAPLPSPSRAQGAPGPVLAGAFAARACERVLARDHEHAVIGFWIDDDGTPKS